MSENAYRGLVNILHVDITPNEKQSRHSTGNSIITANMVTRMGLRFMGEEKSKTLVDAYVTSIKSADRLVDLFLNKVDHATDAVLLTNLLLKIPTQKTKLANYWNKYSGCFAIMYGHLIPIDG